MKTSRYFPLAVAYVVLAMAWQAAPVGAAAPSAQQALRLTPVQPDVDYTRPTPEEAAKCTISAKKFEGKVGWVIEDANGVVLRKFLDTDGDNKVDQWCYFKDGLEVYRDIDSDHNGVADQFRWFNTGGTRWGVDKRETGKIDYWKAISAEEVTAEIVAALATRDAARFARLILTPEELKSLGLGAAKSRQIAEKIDGLEEKFRQAMSRQKEVGPNTQWSQFSGGRPGIVPMATEGSTKDLHVYENVVAVTQTGDKHGQVQIGTLIQVGDVWRVIDLPQPLAPDAQLTANGFFFQTPVPERTQTAADAPSESMQKMLKELERLDALATKAASREEQAKINAQRADVMGQIADQASKPEDRAIWLRQLADMISAAVQAGTFPDGPKLLGTLYEKLAAKAADKELAPYFKFRQLSAEYGQSIQAEGADFVKIQGQWLKKLEDYTSTYPNSPDAAEAMLQLGIAQEYAGQEDECKKWYGRIVKDFPNSAAAKRAIGAQRRLDSVGHPLAIQGKGINGEAVDTSRFHGKIVLVHYWATWCEPCKAELPTIKDLAAKYGSSLAVVGVSLDNKAADLTAYLSQNGLTWPQIYEEGVLDSRPATEMGIVSLPTMILIDQDGKVANRNIHAAELAKEIKKLIH
jgi:thiol-disulfide isomerase/thioredoxin